MNRHPLDPVSLISGLVLVGIGAVYLAGPPEGLGAQARLMATIAMIGFGLALLSSVLPRGEDADDDVMPDPEPD